MNEQEALKDLLNKTKKLQEALRSLEENAFDFGKSLAVFVEVARREKEK